MKMPTPLQSRRETLNDCVRIAGGPTIAKVELAEIPGSHIDLIDGPYWAALTTVMPDGQPQTTPVWCNREGGYVLTNTMRGFRKEKNMRANPRVTLLVGDPRNPMRHIEVRGLVVEMTEDGAVEHDDTLAQLYLGKPGAHFFGDAVPAELAATYVPVKVTIAPVHVRVEVGAPCLNLTPKRSSTHENSKRTNCQPDTVPVDIPQSHRDLLVRPVHGVLSTMLPDGQPQSSIVWVDYDCAHVLINTALERQKCRNMRDDPRVALLVVDPDDTGRWIEVRGRVAEITPCGAVNHADRLTERYTGKRRFYGDVYPVERQQQETRVVVRIEPVKVTHDAIFG